MVMLAEWMRRMGTVGTYFVDETNFVDDNAAPKLVLGAGEGPAFQVVSNNRMRCPWHGLWSIRVYIEVEQGNISEEPVPVRIGIVRYEDGTPAATATCTRWRGPGGAGVPTQIVHEFTLEGQEFRLENRSGGPMKWITATQQIVISPAAVPFIED